MVLLVKPCWTLYISTVFFFYRLTFQDQRLEPWREFRCTRISIAEVPHAFLSVAPLNVAVHYFIISTAPRIYSKNKTTLSERVSSCQETYYSTSVSGFTFVRAGCPFTDFLAHLTCRRIPFLLRRMILPCHAFANIL